MIESIEHVNSPSFVAFCALPDRALFEVDGNFMGHPANHCMVFMKIGNDKYINLCPVPGGPGVCKWIADPEKPFQRNCMALYGTLRVSRRSREDV